MEEGNQEDSEDTKSEQEGEKTQTSIDNDPDKKGVSEIGEKVKSNPWIAVSVVLVIAVIVLLIVNFRGGITGNVISENDAGQKILDFANSQGVAAELVGVNAKGNFYEVSVLINGQESVLSVTKDGEYLAQLIPLDAVATQPNGQQQQPPANVVKSDKPEVELFVMTHCPYGTQAEKGMLPVFGLLGDKIDSSIKFVHYFLHDPEEAETPIQVCIREEQTNKFNDYLACFLEDGDSDRCLTETGIDKAKLDTCVAGKADDYYASDSALSESYGVRGSPTLVINGVVANSGRSPAAYLETICSAFNDAPEECNEELYDLDSVPGFGYTASAGGSTSAQC